MPRRRKSRPRRRRRAKARGAMVFQNTIQATSDAGSDDAQFDFNQLLGPSITGRKVVFQSIKVQIMQQGFGDSTAPLPTVQLRLAGPIWTGSNTNWVPHSPFKLLNKVRPLTFHIKAFLPTMRVPLDAEDTQHLLSVKHRTIFPLSMVIVTRVRLLPQDELEEVTPVNQAPQPSSAGLDSFDQLSISTF